MKISLIYAQNDQRALGYRGNHPMPWHHPEDFQHFKRLTFGKRLIMGMSTFESLPGVLPNRIHHVLTRKPVFHGITGTQMPVRFHPSVSHALLECLGDFWKGDHDEVFLIGGEQVLAEGVELADTIYRTIVRNHPLEGDLALAPADLSEFICVDTVACPTNSNLIFQTYQRREPSKEA